MFCDHPVANLLTAQLRAFPIRHIVVCPGSRNAILTHNFNEAGFILHPVTDERSAGFVALGLIAATTEPVAVCVTSGSAVLNLHPAVAEAQERHMPLLIISADRPPCWIGQLDGQTLPQPLAFAHLHIPHVQLPENISQPTDAWWCERLIREVLTALSQHEGGPGHINVPLSEPLFSFTTPSLSRVRTLQHFKPTSSTLPAEVINLIRTARMPIVCIGQLPPAPPHHQVRSGLTHHKSLLFLPDPLANLPGSQLTTLLEMSAPLRRTLEPDLILHLGGNVVNKQLKNYLRSLPDTTACIRFGLDRCLTDTYRHLAAWVEMPARQALDELCRLSLAPKPAVIHMHGSLSQAVPQSMPQLPYSDLAAMRRIMQQLPPDAIVEVANSRPIRAAAACATDNAPRLYCNRGVNGIEGSLSTAVGHALGLPEQRVYCLIGDLSFFYDVNALWNVNLPRNLCIVLFNNGHGQIFDTLPGLSASPALPRYVSGSHHTSARGIAQSFGLHYLSADNTETLDRVLPALRAPQSQATLIELFTPDDANRQAWQQLQAHYDTLSTDALKDNNL